MLLLLKLLLMLIISVWIIILIDIPTIPDQIHQKIFEVSEKRRISRV